MPRPNTRRRRPSPQALPRRRTRLRSSGSPRRSTSRCSPRSRPRPRSASTPSGLRPSTPPSSSKLKEEGQKVASFLQFNEETTRRRLIDQALIAAGWNVGANGANTEQVRQEVRLTGDADADRARASPTTCSTATTASRSRSSRRRRRRRMPRIGGEQARLYADCLEKETGVRPVIFFTNGVDICLWDDAQGYPSRKVYGFYSKDSLEYLVHQRANKKAAGDRRAEPRHREPHVPARGDQARRRALRGQVPQGAPRAGHRHRQDARRHLALRRAHAGRLGEAHPLPLRPPRAAQAGRPRLQGVPAGRAARHRRRAAPRTTATSASTSPPTRR